MRLVQCIQAVDEYKPNAFTNQQKARWLEAVEGQVHSQALLLSHYDFQPFTYQENWLYTAGEQGLAAGDYRFTLSWRENGQPNTSTRAFTLAAELAAGDRLRWDGTALFRRDTAGDGSAVETQVALTQASTGTLLTFADQSRELLVAPPHDGIYAAYLEAMIDFRNNEYDRYANSVQHFNDLWSELMAYICYHYAPANGV